LTQTTHKIGKGGKAGGQNVLLLHNYRNEWLGSNCHVSCVPQTKGTVHKNGVLGW